MYVMSFFLLIVGCNDLELEKRYSFAIYTTIIIYEMMFYIYFPSTLTDSPKFYRDGELVNLS